MCPAVCVCERETERDRERVCVDMQGAVIGMLVLQCVCERERERDIASVCVCLCKGLSLEYESCSGCVCFV